MKKKYWNPDAAKFPDGTPMQFDGDEEDACDPAYWNKAKEKIETGFLRMLFDLIFGTEGKK